jgi:hypothetical protein
MKHRINYIIIINIFSHLLLYCQFFHCLSIIRYIIVVENCNILIELNYNLLLFGCYFESRLYHRIVQKGGGDVVL